MRFASFILALLAVAQIPGIAQDASKASHAEAESAATVKVAPIYPAVAKQLKIQGVVELEALVSTTGEVQKVDIVSGNPVLSKPAAEALKKWKFKPFMANGKPVEKVVQVAISFAL